MGTTAGMSDKAVICWERWGGAGGHRADKSRCFRVVEANCEVQRRVSGCFRADDSPQKGRSVTARFTLVS